MDEQEIANMIDKLEHSPPGRPGCVIGEYVVTVHGKKQVQRFQVPVLQYKAVLAFLWLFGRRITEVLMLTKSDIKMGYVNSDGIEGIQINFYALKRKKRQKFPHFIPYGNRESQKYIDIISGYMKSVPNKECLRCGAQYNIAPPGERCVKCGYQLTDTRMFPGRTRAEKYKTRYKHQKAWVDKEGVTHPPGTYEVKEYVSPLTGKMGRVFAWKVFHYLNPQAWPHFSRSSLNTRYANELSKDSNLKGMIRYILKEWNDWSSTAPADNYVKTLEGGVEASMALWGKKDEKEPGPTIVNKCQTCDATMPVGASFCSRCGAPMQ